MAVRPLLSEPEQRKAEILLRNASAAGEALLAAAFYEKLGFASNPNASPQLTDLLLDIMQDTSSDFTMTFRQLAFVTIDEMSDPKVLGKHWALKVFSSHGKFKEFVNMYKQYMILEGWYLLSLYSYYFNYFVVCVHNGIFLLVSGLTDEERRSNMLSKNPQYVLRSWMAQEAIKLAEQDDFSGVHFLLEVLSNPFRINEEAETKGFSGATPAWANCIRVSCSS